VAEHRNNNRERDVSGKTLEGLKKNTKGMVVKRWEEKREVWSKLTLTEKRKPSVTSYFASIFFGPRRLQGRRPRERSQGIGGVGEKKGGSRE